MPSVKPSQGAFTEPVRQFTRRYSAALILVASLVIVGQLLIQYNLYIQKEDSRVINIAGRQRMLSQRLSKAALESRQALSPESRQAALNEVANVLKLWQRSHQGLQVGDEGLGLSGKNSAQIREMYADIEDAFQQMSAAATRLGELDLEEDAAPMIADILSREAEFLKGMNAIVFRYDDEARARLQRLRWIELFILSVILLLLILEARHIFAPAVRALGYHMHKQEEMQVEAERLAETLKEQNTTLDEALREAQSVAKLKSEFLATMSHEIRTPMNGTLGMTELLLQSDLNLEQRQYAETLQNSADTLLAILNNILDYSMMEAGKLQLERRPVSLLSLAEEVSNLFAAAAAEKGIELTYRLNKSGPEWIYGDETRIKQVLNNLTGNAIKFTEAGEVQLHFLGSMKDENSGQLTVAVSDSGIGIPEEQREHLFQMFTQADTSTTRKYGGTGLGLAICKRLVEAFGGEIRVESQAGSGTTFYVSWPVEQAPADPEALQQQESMDLNGKRVLIVDDHEANREILESHCSRWGMQVFLATSAEDALQQLVDLPDLDMAILDYHMPGLDGVELATLMKQDPRRSNTPRILLTSHQSLDLQDRALFSAFHYKPIKMNHLYELLRGQLVPQPSPDSEGTTDFEESATRYPLRILIAEDNKVNQMVARKQLARMGYECEWVENGQEVLDRLEKHFDIDVIFMDVHMPEMDGLSSTREIRKRWPGSDQKRAKPWIIAMTANAFEEDRKKCLAAGMDDYLSKPVKGDRLRNKLIQAYRSLQAN